MLRLDSFHKVTRRHESGITSRNVFFAHTHVHEPLGEVSQTAYGVMFFIVFFFINFETRPMPFFFEITETKPFMKAGLHSLFLEVMLLLIIKTFVCF